jgi:hypothetical protein
MGRGRVVTPESIKEPTQVFRVPWAERYTKANQLIGAVSGGIPEAHPDHPTYRVYAVEITAESFRQSEHDFETAVIKAKYSEPPRILSPETSEPA